MRSLRLLCVLILVFFTGCFGGKSLVELNLENKGLVNLCLASNGAKVTVSQDNPDHPASTLINGITSSENWDQGEGWELKYDDEFQNDNELVGHELTDRYRRELGSMKDTFDQDDPSSYGIKIRTNVGMTAPLGWIIIELPEKKNVNRAVIYTIDSDKYPSERFGVSHLVLQYWAEPSQESEVRGWKVTERIGSKSKEQKGNAIQNNKSGVINLRFKPVQTSKMRLAIWWTNDSKIRKSDYGQYISGAIRLVEIEIYGYEAKKPVSAVVDQDADERAQVEVVIETYAEGYNKRDINLLMSSISPNYSKDGEAYFDLKKRMEAIFAKYDRVELELQNVKVKLVDNGATVTATYTMQYESVTDASSPVITSSVLTFSLSKATGYWKITRIDLVR